LSPIFDQFKPVRPATIADTGRDVKQRRGRTQAGANPGRTWSSDLSVQAITQ
jgi:hypothetical protein